MATPLQTAEQSATQGLSSDQRNALAYLGAELLRRAEESQPALQAAWDELMATWGIHGEPLGVQRLRAMIQQESGGKPAANEFSRELIALRQERQAMMFFFLDGSALATRYVAEPGTPLLDYLLDHVAADRLVVLNVGFAEVVSILVRRKNAGSLSAATFSQALLHLGHEIIHTTNLRKVEPTNSLVIAALIHIQIHSVNATNAIVLHAALGLAQHLRSRGDDLVLVASDQRLLRAAQAEGLGTFDPALQDQAALVLLVGP